MDKNKESLIKAIAKAIKESAKGINGNVYCYANVPIELRNWGAGWGNKWKWSSSEIKVGNETYKFTDKEVTDQEMISLAKQALELSGCKGKVLYDECGDGYWISKTYSFNGIKVYGEPCNEFKELNKMLAKYGNKTIGEQDVFHVNVCGKRSSWSDSGHESYLCYMPKVCANIIDYIRHNRLRGWKVCISTEEYFSHGDEMDYRCAQHQESEWYGCRGVMLVTDIKNTKGEPKLHKTFMDFS